MRSANSSSSPNGWKHDCQSAEIDHPSEGLTIQAGCTNQGQTTNKQAMMHSSANRALTMGSGWVEHPAVISGSDAFRSDPSRLVPSEAMLELIAARSPAG